MRAGLAALLAGAALAMPELGQQRTLGVLPGSGIVRRAGPAPKRRDDARQALAKLKRWRKESKRARGAERAMRGREYAYSVLLARGRYGI
jgi:hypothetical protein